jgi:hypothetical protein
MTEYYSQQLRDIENNLTFHKEQVELHQANLKKFEEEIAFNKEQIEIHLDHQVWFKSEKSRVEEKLGRVDKMKETNTFIDKIFRTVAKRFV